MAKGMPLDPRNVPSIVMQGAGSKDDSSSEEEEPVQLRETFEEYIVVGNLPEAPESKKSKLVKVLCKVMAGLGIKLCEKPTSAVHLPINAAGAKGAMTKSFAFVQLPNAEAAKDAVLKLHGHQLDKAHQLKAAPFDDFAVLDAVTDEYVPPEKKEFVEKEFLGEWLVDELGRDQFAVRYADETEVFWNNAHNEPALVINKKNWTETFVSWSPKGSYMATFHEQGIALWGGASWEKMQRFAHAQVKLIDWSPCENYLVTFAPHLMEVDTARNPQSIVVWDVRTGARVHAFTVPPQPDNQMSWPLFKWSHDGKYLACHVSKGPGKDTLHVFELPTMELVLKLKQPNLRGWSWSPSRNVIAYWVPGTEEKPACVVLLKVPKNEHLRQKNLGFDVERCDLVWNKSGKFLACKVQRKKKNTVTMTFELFRVADKNVPVDVIDLGQQTVLGMEWEPHGSKFAIVHGSPQRPDVTFYDMWDAKKKSKELVKLSTLEKKACNGLYWSPRGRFCVLAGLGTMNGVLEFYDTESLTTISEGEHFMATDIEWDPSGRYVCTYVSYWRHKMENGYQMWSFQGKLLQRVKKDRFYQVTWRPRPPSSLSQSDKDRIERDWKKYAQKYTSEESRKERAHLDAQKQARRERRREFLETLRAWKERREAERAEREALRDGAVSDDEAELVVVDEVVEQVVSVNEEVML